MNFFIGTITKILDPDLYTIEVDIPGENQELPAFPKRGEVDEPKVGDAVLLMEVDPKYKSYYLYEKLKENNFIGIRARGKLLKMSADEVVLGIFDSSSEYHDKDTSDPTPAPSSWIKIDSGGNIDITAGGNCTINVSGNAEVKVSGTTNIESGGDATVKAPTVTITGGTLKTQGTSNTDMSGPYNCIPTCPFSGAPHSGSTVSGT